MQGTSSSLNWWVLDRSPEPKVKGLSFLQTRIPSKLSRRLATRFIGLTQGTVNIVNDAAAVEAKCEEGVVMSLISSGSVIKEGQTMTATTSKTKITERRTTTERIWCVAPNVKPTPVNPGASLEGTHSAGKGEGEEGMEKETFLQER
jgi:hypothetical protein